MPSWEYPSIKVSSITKIDKKSGLEKFQNGQYFDIAITVVVGKFIPMWEYLKHNLDDTQMLFDVDPEGWKGDWRR